MSTDEESTPECTQTDYFITVVLVYDKVLQLSEQSSNTINPSNSFGEIVVSNNGEVLVILEVVDLSLSQMIKSTKSSKQLYTIENFL